MEALKKTWPQGVWHGEPDESRWRDADSGLDCLVMRGPHGAWCGYVGVPDTHPAFGVSYYKTGFDLFEVASGRAQKQVNVQHQVNEIIVHGGMTYSGSDTARGDGLHWFGFDCAHAGDFCPGYQGAAQLGKPTGWGGVVEYRDLEYVQNECVSLAKQLAAIDPSKTPTDET